MTSSYYKYIPDSVYKMEWITSEQKALEKYIKDSANLWAGHTDTVPHYILGATIGTHVGPGVVGVAFFEKNV